MINLIPTEEKRQIRAARVNTILLRYTFIMLLAGAFLALILAGSYFLLTMTKNSADELIVANDTSTGEFAGTQQEIDALSSELTEAKTVLDNQISYSDTLARIGAAMPAGTVVESLALAPEYFSGTPMTVTIYAADDTIASNLQGQLSISPYFTSVSINSTSADEGIEGYPVSVEVSWVLDRRISQ